MIVINKFYAPDAGGGGGQSMDAASLLPAAIQTAYGLGNIFFSGRKKRERELENMANNAPQYAGDTGISNYYNTALQRYNVNPVDSAMYKRSVRDIGRNTSTALGAMVDRRAGVGSIGAITQQANDAAVGANVQAELQRNQRFGELGNATQMQGQDNLFKFKTNTLDPYQLKLSLAGMKAKAANDRYNNGWQSFMGGINNASTVMSSAASKLLPMAL